MAIGDRFNALMEADVGASVAPLSEVAPVEYSPAVAAHAVGSYISYNSVLYRVTAAISIGDTLTAGTNIVSTDIADEIRNANTAIEGKQAALTFDGTPTANSANPVTSGGVKTALDTKTPVIGKGENLLDNWYFVNPVNQRGKTNYISSDYTIDRWKLIARDLNVTNNGIELTNAAGSSFGATIRQAINNPGSLVGHKLTLSALVSSVESNGYIHIMKAGGFNSETVVLATATISSPGLHSVTVTVPNDVGGSTYPLLLVSLASYKEKSAVFTAAKLELGDTQTLAHQDANGNWVLNDPPPNYQQELAKCQRYFRRIQGQYTSLGSGFVKGTDKVLFGIPVNTMRKNISTSSVVVSGHIYFLSNEGIGANALPSVIESGKTSCLVDASLVNGNAPVMYMYVSVANATPGIPIVAQLRDDESYIDINADL